MGFWTRSPGEIAERMSRRLSEARSQRQSDGYKRESFVLPREKAHQKALEIFAAFPKAAYRTDIESWRELADGQIEFIMRRLPSVD